MSEAAPQEPTEVVAMPRKRKGTDIIAAPAHVPTSLTPMEMLAAAVQRDASLEVLNGLMALQERWEKNQSRRAFDNAMADAKGEIPPIIKNREVDFTSQKGRTHYRHEDLMEIARTVDPILKKYGLSYRFRSTQEGQRITVSCIISHRDGYAEETSLTAGEDHTGNKNQHQAVASAATYLQRYTLKLALGLAAGLDDDGQSAGKDAASLATITEAQEDTLRELIEATDSSIPGFCRYFKIDKLCDLKASDFDRAKAALSKKAHSNG